uniref:G-protein coupled receptors family 1 profile domain-containing protein n=1 Tax=Acrobeloides nanus TaxID=290746 RepID=A0A914D9B4_9BILA
MLPNASAGILVLLSIERFIAVVRPMIVQDLLTTRVLLRCVLIVWIGSAVMNLPYIFAVQFMELYDPESGTKHAICARKFLTLADINLLQVVTTVNLFVWYIIPLAMLMVIYVTIGIVLLGSTKSDSVVRSSVCAKPLERKATTTSLLTKDETIQIQSTKTLTNEALDSRKRVIRLVIVLVLAFAVLSLPRHMYLIWSVWRDTNAPRCLNCLAALIQPATFLLYFFNSGLNPLLYAFLSRRFRSAILDTFQQCFCFKEWRQKKTSLEICSHNRSLHKNSNIKSFNS